MQMSITLKYVTTLSLFFCYFFYGVNFYVIGPTLIELAALFNTTIEKISFIYTVRMTGYTLGSLSGFLFTYINRQLAFIFFMALMGLTVILMPHCSSLFQLFSLGAINGFSIGSFDAAINVWILEMWGKESGPYMQALHFNYGLGSFIAPLICEPFLSKKALIGHHMRLSDLESVQYNRSESMVTNNSSLNLTNYTTDEEIRSNPQMIYIPYAFTGIFSITGAAAVLVLYLYKKYEPPLKTNNCSKICLGNEDLINSNKNYNRLMLYVNRNTPPLITICLVTMGSFFLTFFVGMEHMHLQFLPTFAVNTDLNISPSTAAFITSAAAAAFTIGRGLSIPLAIKLRPQAILYTNHFMMISGITILAIFANTSMAMMVTGNIILGAGFSSVYPSFYAFLEQQFQVTNIIGSIFVFASGLTSAVSPSLVGGYIENNPLVLIWFNFFCVFVCLSIFVIIHITICLKNRQNIVKLNSIIEEEITQKVMP